MDIHLQCSIKNEALTYIDVYNSSIKTGCFAGKDIMFFTKPLDVIMKYDKYKGQVGSPEEFIC